MVMLLEKKMKGKIQIVGEPGVPKKKNIASVSPQVVLYGNPNILEPEEIKIVEKFVEKPKIKGFYDRLAAALYLMTHGEIP